MVHLKKDKIILAEKPLFTLKQLATINVLSFFLILSLIALFVFRKYIFLESFYIFKDIGSDTYNQFYPLYTHFSQYFKSEGIPKWTFSQGMGQNMFPGGINNPFILILYLLGPELIPFAFGYIEVIKIILAGLIFHYYLNTLGMTKYVQFIGGILFAFSGYMIVGSGWYGHSTFVLYGACILLAFEKLFRNEQWIYFPIAIFLLSSLSFFYLIPFGFFMIIYAFIRCMEEKTDPFREWGKLCAKMILLGTSGVGMNAFFAIHDIMRMMDSPRVSGESGFFENAAHFYFYQLSSLKEIITAIARTFSNDLLGVGSAFTGWNNYLEAPTLYSGSITLLVLPQTFLLFSKKKRTIYLSFLSFWIIIILFPYFRHFFYLFAGDYYKGGVSFFISTTLLYIGMRALNEIDKTNTIHKKMLLATVIILLLLLTLSLTLTQTNFRKDMLSGTVLFLLAQFTLFYLLPTSSNKAWIKHLLVILICFEAGLFSYVTTNVRMTFTPSEYLKQTGYNDHTLEALHHIKDQGPLFFRIEKDYASGTCRHRSMNDAQIQGYFGTRSYYSFNQKYYIRFLAEMGVLNPENELQTRWANGFFRYPLLQSFGAVKYHLNKYDYKNYLPFGFEKIARFGDVTVLKNNSFLPLGFTYDHFLTVSEFKKLPLRQRQCTLFNAAILENSDRSDTHSLKRYLPSITSEPPEIKACLEPIKQLLKDTFQISSFKHNRIEGSIQLNQPKIVFFSIPYDLGWEATVNGEKMQLKLCNIGFMALILEKGSYQISLQFQPKYYHLGFYLSLTFILATSLLFGYRYYYYKKL